MQWGALSVALITYRPIGRIHSPFPDVQGMPIQAAFAQAVEGTVVLDEDYADGLEGLDGFSHVILIYHFHLSEGYQLQVRPFLAEEMHGVFATRAPRRPNAIGISVVRLHRVEGRTLYVSGLDIVDGTPVLDIKPYVPQFDDRGGARIGWLEERIHRARHRKADDRFG
jgi:tRNA-Thr(GGU) m(6)t(6)A37 methyltransferase TsaA